MRRLLYILLMLVVVGCESNLLDDAPTSPTPGPSDPGSGGDGDLGPGDTPGTPGSGQTIPIKRRPIWPGSQTERPRFAVVTLDGSIVIRLASCAEGPVTLTLRCEATGFEYSATYTADGDYVVASCCELSGEVVVITEAGDDMTIEYFELLEE